MKKIFFAAFIMLLSAAALFACDMSYSLTDEAGKTVKIHPDETVEVQKEGSYILNVTFKENHGRCTVPAEDTVFLLDDEKWKFGKGELPFVISGEYTWESVSKTEHKAEIPFRAEKTGEIYLEVIRECSRKEGYDEYLVFNVNSRGYYPEN